MPQANNFIDTLMFILISNLWVKSTNFNIFFVFR